MGIVLSHLGVEAPLAEVRACARTTASGTSLLDLRECARSYGLAAEGWRMAHEDLRRIHLPAVVLIDDRHFVVLVAVEHDRVRLIDPEAGEFAIAIPHFLRRWKGYTLVVESIDKERSA